MLNMIMKCTKIAKQLYVEICLEEEIDSDRESANDKSQESNHNDNSATNSEEIPINQIAL